MEDQQPLDGIPDDDHLDSGHEELSTNEEIILTLVEEPVHSDCAPSTSAPDDHNRGDDHTCPSDGSAPSPHSCNTTCAMSPALLMALQRLLHPRLTPPHRKDLQKACNALGVSGEGSDMVNRLQELLNFTDIYPKLFTKLQKTGVLGLDLLNAIWFADPATAASNQRTEGVSENNDDKVVRQFELLL
ncbi:unnamed protein product [Boreogadus saida]